MTYLPTPDRYDAMAYRYCGRSGLRLPVLSLGLWHNFGDTTPLSVQREMVHAAFDLGITHFDLANNYGPPYGTAEINFGRILREDLGAYRDELVISSKAGWDMWPGPYGQGGGSRKYVLASLDQSLRRVGVDYFDIFYSHRCDADTPLEETMGALAHAVRQGKALYVGISSYSATKTREAAALLRAEGVPLLIHQPSYNLLNRWVEPDLLDALGELGVGMIAFTALAQGLLTDKYLDGIPAEARVNRPGGDTFSRDMLSEANLARVRALNEIARRRGQSLAQMAYAWVLRDPRVTTTLIGASSVAQVRENVAALANLSFSPEELAEIDRHAVDSGVNLWEKPAPTSGCSSVAVSAFDLFKIGIGPSSSHTVGPMRAAAAFAHRLERSGVLARATRVRAELYGSLGATGRGHGTDKAVLLGLEGEQPDSIDVDAIPARLAAIRAAGRLALAGSHPVAFDEAADLVFSDRAGPGRETPFHVNNLRLLAYDLDGAELASKAYYSVGGGFVVSDDLAALGTAPHAGIPDVDELPYPYHSAEELLALVEAERCTIADLVRRNERAWRDDDAIDAGLLRIWGTMQACVERGLRADGVLPGPLAVRRRAPALQRALAAQAAAGHADPLSVLDWVNLWALAVNEENAAGGRVVTAPTNGAAGIVPAVLHYYARHVSGATERGIIDFLLTSTAIGILYTENASISGAEVGCQGEVGVACSMAAAGLCAVLGGTPAQVENAAEIGIEHHLGLTCDPVGGLVQIPCIERNAIASVKAINAARMALAGDGTHHVSLDAAIKTMRETGADMATKYKETSRGGLALNVVEC
jgi:L-serine dehydratase